MIGARLVKVLFLAAAAGAVAFGAQAQTALQSFAPVRDDGAAKPLDLSFSHTELGAAAAQASALRAAGLAQTSVDGRLAGDGLTGSLGFLCGRQATYNHSGIADARGYDPDGKFLGAKLSLAFR